MSLKFDSPIWHHCCPRIHQRLILLKKVRSSASCSFTASESSRDAFSQSALYLLCYVYWIARYHTRDILVQDLHLSMFAPSSVGFSDRGTVIYYLPSYPSSSFSFGFPSKTAGIRFNSQHFIAVAYPATGWIRCPSTLGDSDIVQPDSKPGLNNYLSLAPLVWNPIGSNRREGSKMHFISLYSLLFSANSIP